MDLQPIAPALWRWTAPHPDWQPATGEDPVTDLGEEELEAAVMQAAGVATATTCVPGLVRLRDGETRFFLPRFLDGGDVSMIEFEAEMSGVLQLLRTLTRRADLTAHALQPSPT